jgi:hypothetical protein
MRRKADSLKLGKGQAFDKPGLKRLRQKDDTWEDDFRAGVLLLPAVLPGTFPDPTPEDLQRDAPGKRPNAGGQ